MSIKFSPPNITSHEIKEVLDVLNSGWITTGPKTKLFEKLISDYCHTPKAVALNSATACMELTLRLFGIGPGDEVITTAYTYTASASVIAHVGAKIVLVDTQKDTFHMDVDALFNAITDKTKAIIPVDIAGVMPDYSIIRDVADRKRYLFKSNNELQSSFGRVIIIADAAHSFGARFGVTMSGAEADFTSFSFHAVKNLTTGEGGAVTWKSNHAIDNEDLYYQYQLLSLHGQTKDALSKSKYGTWEYDIIAPYFKCNMTDIAAALGVAQLQRYNCILEKRRLLITKYDELLSCLNATPLKHYTDDYTSSGHLYMLNINGKTESFRNSIIERLSLLGIPSNVHYKPLPMFTAYKNLGFNIKDFPNSYAMYKNEISLPLHTQLSDNDLEFICTSLKNVLTEKLHD